MLIHPDVSCHVTASKGDPNVCGNGRDTHGGQRQPKFSQSKRVMVVNQEFEEEDEEFEHVQWWPRKGSVRSLAGTHCSLFWTLTSNGEMLGARMAPAA